jgi:hypothetical protein
MILNWTVASIPQIEVFLISLWMWFLSVTVILTYLNLAQFQITCPSFEINGKWLTTFYLTTI